MQTPRVIRLALRSGRTGVAIPSPAHVRPCRATRRVLLTACLAGGALQIGCQPAPISTRWERTPHEVTAYIVVGGWHTAVALPGTGITGPLQTLVVDFPEARYLMFGRG